MIPHEELAAWRALLEIAAILSASVSGAAVWCLHRIRRPLLELSKRLDEHEARVSGPAVAALDALEDQVAAGFRESVSRHSEIRETLDEQTQTLVEHGARLATLEDRTEILLSRMP